MPPNRPRLNPPAFLWLCPDCSTRQVVLRRCPQQGCFFHPRPITSTSEPSGLHCRFQLARCSSSVAQCPWTIKLCSDWDCSTRPDVLRRCPQRAQNKGVFSIRDQLQPLSSLVSTLGSNWRRAQGRWLKTNHQADASGQAPILSKWSSTPIVRCFSLCPSSQRPTLLSHTPSR